MTEDSKIILEEAVSSFINQFNQEFLIENADYLEKIKNLEKNLVFPDDYQDMYDYLQQKLSNLTITSLKNICVEYNLSKTGNKDELIKKIIQKKIILTDNYS